MAETAIGVLGLLGLFNNAIDWFHYVHITKNYTPRLQTLILKLDDAHLRLARWGDAAGLSGDIDEFPDQASRSDFRISNDPSVNAKVKQRLILFHEQFEKCKNDSHLAKKSQPPVEEIDPARVYDRNPTRGFLHEKFRVLVQHLKNNATVVKKGKFAIYDEKNLTDLIDSIMGIIDGLYILVPIHEGDFDRLIKREIEEFKQVFTVLEQITKETRDAPLQAAVSQIFNNEVS